MAERGAFSPEDPRSGGERGLVVGPAAGQTTGRHGPGLRGLRAWCRPPRPSGPPVPASSPPSALRFSPGSFLLPSCPVSSSAPALLCPLPSGATGSSPQRPPPSASQPRPALPLAPPSPPPRPYSPHPCPGPFPWRPSPGSGALGPAVHPTHGSRPRLAPDTGPGPWTACPGRPAHRPEFLLEPAVGTTLCSPLNTRACTTFYHGS